MSTAARPLEGLTRCPCGAKYWDDDRCASCGDRYRPDPEAPPRIDSVLGPLGPGECAWCRSEGRVYRYGTNDAGQTFWSPTLCSEGCHDEMYSS